MLLNKVEMTQVWMRVEKWGRDSHKRLWYACCGARVKRLRCIGKCLKIGFLKSICPLLYPSSRQFQGSAFQEQIHARSNSLFNPHGLVFSATFDFTRALYSCLARCVHLAHPSLTESSTPLTMGEPLDSIFGPLLLFMCTFSFGFLKFNYHKWLYVPSFYFNIHYQLSVKVKCHYFLFLKDHLALLLSNILSTWNEMIHSPPPFPGFPVSSVVLWFSQSSKYIGFLFFLVKQIL